MNNMKEPVKERFGVQEILSLYSYRLCPQGVCVLA